MSSSWTLPDSSPARSAAKGSATASSPGSARSTPCALCSVSFGRRGSLWHHRPSSRRSSACSSSVLRSPTSRPSRASSRRTRGTGNAAPCRRHRCRWRRREPSLAEGTPLYRSSSVPRGERRFLSRSSSSRTRPSSASLNIAEGEIGDVEAGKAVREELGEGALVVPVCVQLEAEAALLGGRWSGVELMEGRPWARGAIPRVARRGAREHRAERLFDHRRQGAAAWTLPLGGARPRIVQV